MPFPIAKLVTPDDFNRRFARARISALRKFVGPVLEDEEEEKLVSVSLDKREELLRSVFENSKKFGESAKWHFGAEWEPLDFKDIVSKSSTSCFCGNWNEDEEQDSVMLEREG